MATSTSTSTPSTTITPSSEEVVLYSHTTIQNESSTPKPLLRPPTDPTQWTYLSEGRKHIVFAFTSKIDDDDDDCSSSSPFSHHVLRIPKSCLAAASAYHPEHSKPPNNNKLPLPQQQPLLSSLKRQFHFFHKILRPSLGKQYIDLPLIVPLEYEFVTELIHRTQTDFSISRQMEWNDTNSHSQNNEWSRDDGCCCWVVGTGTLMRNHTILLPPLHSPINNNNNTISIEIKPKGGYIPLSPLIRPSHHRDIKLHCTKFEIMQRLQCHGIVTKGWRRTKNDECRFQKSDYDPIDFFSGDESKLRKAIRSLFRCPQNNLRVMINGTVVLDHEMMRDSKHAKMLVGEEMMHACFPCSDMEDDCVWNVIMECALRILLQENTLLQNLLNLQLYDVLETSGAIQVYEHFLFLCNDNISEADEMIDNYETYHEDYYHQQRSPILNRFIDVVSCFRHAVNDNETNEDAYFDQKHDQAKELVRQFSKEDCVYLLQRWLISLMACDVSLFVTFCPVEEEDDNGLFPKTLLQTEHQPGCCILVGRDLLRGRKKCQSVLRYEVKVVDCDLKPANKLRDRKRYERDVDELLRR